MSNILEILENYNKIEGDIKFAANSLVRLKLLFSLKNKTSSMKALSKIVNVSYCSLTANANTLELKEWLDKDLNQRYFLTNISEIYLDNVEDVTATIEFTKKFEGFLILHDISAIPKKSLLNLYLLLDSEVIESNSNEIYMFQKNIEKALKNAKNVKAILPFSYLDFPKFLNQLLKDNISLDILFHESILELFLDEMGNNFKYDSFNKDNKLLLVVTDKIMILGLYFKEGSFDQHRLLVSKSNDSLKWAEELYKNFKEENYLKYSSK